MIEPKDTPFAVSGRVLLRPVAQAVAPAAVRIASSATVISSARRWIEPGENTCGVLRWMKRATSALCVGSRWTFDDVRPAPSSVGTLWQALQFDAFGPVSRAGK